MLPPIVHNLVMVPIHQDVIKPRPENPPVKPIQASDKEAAVSLEYDDSTAALEDALAEQKRKRKARQPSSVTSEPDTLQDDQVPRPRQGGWIDIEV